MYREYISLEYLYQIHKWTINESKTHFKDNGYLSAMNWYTYLRLCHCVLYLSTIKFKCYQTVVYQNNKYRIEKWGHSCWRNVPIITLDSVDRQTVGLNGLLRHHLLWIRAKLCNKWIIACYSEESIKGTANICVNIVFWGI